MSTQLEPAAKRDISIGQTGLQLQNIGDAWKFAQCVAASGLAPKGLEKPEAILVALQLGFEIGLSPMAALQQIAVINGRPMVWGDAPLAVCRASCLFDEAAFSEEITSDGKTLTATCTVLRKGSKPVSRTFSMEDAKTAGLLDKGPVDKPGPWKLYPRRMLQMRARSWALRDAFTDILRGVRIREETGGAAEVDALLDSPTPQELIDVAATPDAATATPGAQTNGSSDTAVTTSASDAQAAADLFDQPAANDAARADDRPSAEHVTTCVADFRAQTDGCQTFDELRRAWDGLLASKPHRDILLACAKIKDCRKEELTAAGKF